MEEAGIQSLYREYKAGNERAKKFLSLEDWVSAVFKFDPKTARPLSQGLSEFLWRISRYQPEEVPRDPVWRIAHRVAPALHSVFRMLDEDPRRELVPMRLRKVRELDDASLRRLSTRPGRNIREKIAAKPTLLAPRRFMSIDVPENRLTKAFVRRLADLLEERRVHLGEDDCSTELLPKLRAWLRTDEARAIGKWTNTPPNNALLSHRDYRKILDSWRALRRLKRLNWKSCDAALNRKQTWEIFCENWMTDEMSFADAPVQFCGTTILNALVEKDNELPQNAAAERGRVDSKEVRDHLGIPDPQNPISKGFFGDVPSFHAFVGTSPAEGDNPLCVDVASHHPDWETPSEKGRLTETYLHQRWTREEDKNDVVEFDLFHATGFTKGRDGWTVETVGLPDLLFQSRVPCAGAAARSFCERLKESFGPRGRMVWLVPDATSDFAASELRSAMSLAFSFAEPLPRSVAAVMAHIPYQSLRPGFRAVVIDRIGGVESRTQLIARRDERLRKSVPETNGYYWERQPTATGEESVFSGSPGFPEWPCESRDWNPPDKPGKDQISWRSPDVDCVVTVRRSPTEGGIRFLELAVNAKDPDTSLWKDCLPPLSMGGIIRNGMYAEFVLVGENDRTHTTILPKRGEIHAIPVQEMFVLPAMSSEQKEYRFQLRKGNVNGSFPYEAILRPQILFSEKARCKLDLTYEYGARHPYRLVFSPAQNEKQSFEPFEAEWILMQNQPLINSPKFPNRKTVEYLSNFPTRFGNKDLFRECSRSISRFIGCEETEYRRCRIDSDVRRATNGQYVEIVFADSETHNEGGRARLWEKSYFRFAHFGVQRGSYVYCFVLPRVDNQGNPIPHQFVGWYPWVANEYSSRGENEALKRSLRSICSYLKPIVSHLKSVVSDNQNGDRRTFRVFLEMVANFCGHLPHLDKILNPRYNQYRLYTDMCVLASCILSRRPDWSRLSDSALMNDEYCQSILRRNPSLFKEMLPFVLRNLDPGRPSQKRALHLILQSPQFDDSSRLEMLGSAVWRHRDFVREFSKTGESFLHCYSKLPEVLESDFRELSNVNDLFGVRNELTSLSRHLEFLLGLLRLRKESPETCPDQFKTTNIWTEEIVLLLDRVTPQLIELEKRWNLKLNDVALVQLNIEKPKELSNTPDLIYACRSYLTNDQVAEAVQVLGVGETLEDNDDE